ncbi:MAG: DUF2490 domain-containing protein [Phycisphaerae bacterium]|nr:DUF2490 domain-containing protein [Phycisphaerae bacterium]
MRNPGLMLLMGLAVSTLCLVCQTCAGDECEYWGQVGVVMPLQEPWEIEAEETLKWREGFGGLFKHNTNVGLAYSGLGHGLDVAIGFRRLYEKEDDGLWTTEDRPHVNVKISTDIRGMQISNRSRFEYRMLEDHEYWRYRNLIKVKFPSLGTDWHVRPYLAMEPHFDMTRGGFDKNRFYTGLGFDITPRISGTAYYLLERRQSDGQWQSLNALGTSLVFHLK